MRARIKLLIAFVTLAGLATFGADTHCWGLQSNDRADLVNTIIEHFRSLRSKHVTYDAVTVWPGGEHPENTSSVECWQNSEDIVESRFFIRQSPRDIDGDPDDDLFDRIQKNVEVLCHSDGHFLFISRSKFLDRAGDLVGQRIIANRNWRLQRFLHQVHLINLGVCWDGAEFANLLDPAFFENAQVDDSGELVKLVIENVVLEGEPCTVLNFDFVRDEDSLRLTQLTIRYPDWMPDSANKVNSWQFTYDEADRWCGWTYHKESYIQPTSQVSATFTNVEVWETDEDHVLEFESIPLANGTRLALPGETGVDYRYIDGRFKKNE